MKQKRDGDRNKNENIETLVFLIFYGLLKFFDLIIHLEQDLIEHQNIGIKELQRTKLEFFGFNGGIDKIFLALIDFPKVLTNQIKKLRDRQ